MPPFAGQDSDLSGSLRQVSSLDFLLSKATREAVEQESERKRQKYLKRELEWVRRGPRARRTKSVDRIERYFEMAAQDGPEE